MASTSANPDCLPSPTGTSSSIQVHSPALPEPDEGCSLFYDPHTKSTASVPSFFEQQEAYCTTEEWPIHWLTLNKQMYKVEDLEPANRELMRKDLVFYYKKWHHSRSEPPKLYPSRKDWLKEKPSIQESFRALLTFDMVLGYGLDKKLLTKYYPNEGRLKELLETIENNFPTKPEVPYFPKPYWSTPFSTKKSGLSLDDSRAAAMHMNLQAEAWIFKLMCYNNYHLSPDIFRYQREKILLIKNPFGRMKL